MRILQGRRVVPVVLAAGLIAFGLIGAPGPAAADSSDELGYPSTINTDHDAEDLPRTPGRMSGSFVGLGAPTSMASAMTGTTFLVSETGRSYQLPQTQDVVGYAPALSPDGTRLAYFPDADAYVIRDLVSGKTTKFPRIQYGDFGTDDAYTFEGSTALWSPDGTHLLLFAGSTVVLSLDGTITEARPPRGRSPHPVGWIDDEIAWVDWRGSDIDDPDSGELVVAPVAGGPGRTVRLADVSALSEVVKAGEGVSPDGSSLAVVTPDGEERGRFTLYSTADGTVTARSAVDHAVNPNCPLSWVSGQPAVAGSVELSSLGVGGGSGSTALVAMSGEIVVRSRDRFPPCSVWAADALSGPRDSGGVQRVLASGGSIPAYVVVPVVVVAGAVTSWLLVARSRRRRAATA